MDGNDPITTEKVGATRRNRCTASFARNESYRQLSARRCHSLSQSRTITTPIALRQSMLAIQRMFLSLTISGACVVMHRTYCRFTSPPATIASSSHRSAFLRGRHSLTRKFDLRYMILRISRAGRAPLRRRHRGLKPLLASKPAITLSPLLSSAQSVTFFSLRVSRATGPFYQLRQVSSKRRPESALAI